MTAARRGVVARDARSGMRDAYRARVVVGADGCALSSRGGSAWCTRRDRAAWRSPHTSRMSTTSAISRDARGTTRLRRARPDR